MPVATKQKQRLCVRARSTFTASKQKKCMGGDQKINSWSLLLGFNRRLNMLRIEKKFVKEGVVRVYIVWRVQKMIELTEQ